MLTPKVLTAMVLTATEAEPMQSRSGPHGRRRPTVRAAAMALAVLTAGVAALAGCAPGPAAAPETTPQVEVYSWWASGSEKLALDALVGVFGEQFPETRFVDSGIAGGAGWTAKDLLRSRLESGDAPDTFQVHGGAELAEYVAAGQVQVLDGLFDEVGLREALPDRILDLVSVDGALYAVPSNIHRANLVWANPDVLRAAGLDPAERYASLDEWFVALDAVAATGRTPLAVGSTWTQVHLLEQVLLSRLGPAGYTALWDGSADAGSPEVLAALEDFQRLMGYANTDRGSLDWQDTTQRVIDGEAGFTVMGDWALGAFAEDGGVAPTDVVWAPMPGTAGTYNAVLDAFTLPSGAPHPTQARQWLQTVASAEGQIQFSNAKGAIPARVNLGTEKLGTYQRAALGSFRTDVMVLSVTHGAAVDSPTLSAVSSAVSRFTAGQIGTQGLSEALVDALG